MTKHKYLQGIPRALSISNIDKAIQDYLKLIKGIPNLIQGETTLKLLNKIKRDGMITGPYAGLTFIESANRIMTDLVILYGIEELLNGKIEELCFDEYIVEFGNENNNDYDIYATDGTKEMIGEAFNVAESFFQTKKSSALKKMRCNANKKISKLLIYNSDAVESAYSPKCLMNEFHLPIKCELE